MSSLPAPVIFQRPIEPDKQDEYGVEAGAEARGGTENEMVLDSIPEEQYFVIPEGKYDSLPFRQSTKDRAADGGLGGQIENWGFSRHHF